MNYTRPICWSSAVLCGACPVRQGAPLFTPAADANIICMCRRRRPADRRSIRPASTPMATHQCELSLSTGLPRSKPLEPIDRSRASSICCKQQSRHARSCRHSCHIAVHSHQFNHSRLSSRFFTCSECML